MQYKVEFVSSKGKIAAGELLVNAEGNIGWTLQRTIDEAKRRYPKYTYWIAKEDLEKGDFVEIFGDYAVKVQAPISGATLPSAAYMQTNVAGPKNEVNRISTDPVRESCTCPFGPNLGPIEHVTNCKERK